MKWGHDAHHEMKKETQRNRKPKYIFKEVITEMKELGKHVPQETEHFGGESV